ACSKRSCRLDQTAAPPGPAAAMRRTPGPLRVVEKRGLSCDVFLYFPRQDGNPRLTWQAAKRGRVPLLRPLPVQERKPVHQACPTRRHVPRMSFVSSACAAFLLLTPLSAAARQFPARLSPIGT